MEIDKEVEETEFEREFNMFTRQEEEDRRTFKDRLQKQLQRDRLSGHGADHAMKGKADDNAKKSAQKNADDSADSADKGVENHKTVSISASRDKRKRDEDSGYDSKPSSNRGPQGMSMIRDIWGEEAAIEFETASVACCKDVATYAKDYAYDKTNALDTLREVKHTRQLQRGRGLTRNGFQPKDVADARNALQKVKYVVAKAHSTAGTKNKHDKSGVFPKPVVGLSEVDDNSESSPKLQRRALFLITPHDLNLLRPKRWLNDTIIQALGETIEDLIGSTTIMICDPCFVKTPVSSKQLHQRATAAKTIVMPVEIQQHWVLAVINPEREGVDVYDSLRNSAIENDVEEKVRVAYGVVTDKVLDAQFNWTLPHIQKNDYNGGVHACITLMCLAAEIQVPTWIDAVCGRRLIEAILGPEKLAASMTFSREFKSIVERGTIYETEIFEYLSLLHSEERAAQEMVHGASKWASFACSIIVKLIADAGNHQEPERESFVRMKRAKELLESEARTYDAARMITKCVVE